MVLDLSTEIEILLYDQSKIVTYKLLNSKFELTPSEAKSRLTDFVKNGRDGSRNLTFFVTFIVIGENKETKKKKVFLVNEPDLEKTCDEFRIISKQIYSVQKNFVDDFDLFFNSDLDVSMNIERKSNIGLVKNCYRSNEPPKDIKASHSSNTISQSSTSSSASSTSKSKTTGGFFGQSESSASTKTKEAKIDGFAKKVENHHEEPKKEAAPKPAEKEQKKTDIGSMFANHKPPAKKEEKKIEPVPAVKKEPETHESPEKVVKKSPKCNYKKSKENKAKKSSSKKEIEIFDEEIIDETDEKAEPSDLFDDEANAPMEIETKSGDKEASDEEEYDDEIINKKRKRKNKSQQALNSDDEADEGKKKNKSSNGSQLSNHATQKKQLVTKTYTDQDGFTVTEKVWEFVEDTDVKNEPKEKHPNKEHEAKPLIQMKKHAEPKVQKSQATLISFFKKK